MDGSPRRRPAVGPELGLSGLLQPEPHYGATMFAGEGRDGYGYSERFEDVGPAYVAFAASPLRFGFGELTISALEGHVGTSLSPPGRLLRLQLGFVSLGWQR